MIIFLQITGGLALLLIGGETLVRGATRVATRFGLSRLIVGMVIAGFGTSLPEVVVSVRAVLADGPGLAAGNVVGSNIANILLILAIAALVRPIDAARRRLEPEGIVLIVVTVGFVFLGLQGALPRWQGALMIALLLTLVTLKLRQDRMAERLRRANSDIVETVAPIPVHAWPTLA
ncbi:MAG: sodium:calcium antiporter, partial [Hyphomicrobiales bacterium]|nr:sodium:calcium antiporter [Hyphomicrobiales bacterium]